MSKFLHISEAATIALHSMGLIAKSNHMLNTQEIAETTGFSKNHISKILQQLVKNGYLASTRGPKGGFLITEKSKNANLMEIYNLIEGDLTISNCKMQCKNCPFNTCLFGGLEQKFSNEFKNYLKQKKVMEM